MVRFPHWILKKAFDFQRFGLRELDYRLMRRENIDEHDFPSPSAACVFADAD